MRTGSPTIVDTPQGRMVRTPAGGSIPEANFLAMVTPRRPPSDEQLEEECRRLGLPGPIPRERVKALARDLVDFHCKPNHPLRQPTFDEKVVAAGTDGNSRRHEAETLAVEQIASAMRAGAPRPTCLPQIGALSTSQVVVAVEIGSAWLDRSKTLYPRAGRRVRENFAVSRFLRSISIFHPEKAAKLSKHREAVLVAIQAWCRPGGRPRKGEHEGSKWDAISTLCELIGIRDRQPETIKRAWQRSEKK